MSFSCCSVSFAFWFLSLRRRRVEKFGLFVARWWWPSVSEIGLGKGGTFTILRFLLHLLETTGRVFVSASAIDQSGFVARTYRKFGREN